MGKQDFSAGLLLTEVRLTLPVKQSALSRGKVIEIEWGRHRYFGLPVNVLHRDIQ